MKSRILIRKRLEESRKRLENLQIESEKDKYYKLSYEITNKTLEEILNENITEDELWVLNDKNNVEIEWVPLKYK